MKEKEQNPLERKLDEQSFENAAKAIKGGKENGSLTYADKGEATVRDAMAALMLAAIMKKESEED